VKILFVTSELHPFAKSGGLADATASLAQAFADENHDIRVVLPRYYRIDRGLFERHPAPLGIPIGDREEWAAVYEKRDNGVRVYCIDHEGLFGRDGIYGPEPHLSFDDNVLRFSFLSRAALQLCLAADFHPDVIHIHDWPSSVLPAIKEELYPTQFSDVPVVLTIHNIGYQGTFPLRSLAQTGLTWNQAEKHGLVYNGEINFLHSAVHSSDRVITVSPTYAREITRPEFSFGLDSTIAQRLNPVTGILNGIDPDEWNPATDAFLPAHFSAASMNGKHECRIALQRELGLPLDETAAILGMVTRLVDQKGIGALFGPAWGSAYRICSELPVQMVVLGSGEQWCENELLSLARSLPNLKVVIGYDNRLAHLIEAGLDFFLMPSVYEPCGLNQMYSMRYGTLPIVTRTGGLADSVDDESGFFISHLSPDGIFDTIRNAVDLFEKDKKTIRRMRRYGMKKDFSWVRSAQEYLAVYRQAIRDRNGEPG